MGATRAERIVHWVQTVLRWLAAVGFLLAGLGAIGVAGVVAYTERFGRPVVVFGSYGLSLFAIAVILMRKPLRDTLIWTPILAIEKAVIGSFCDLILGKRRSVTGLLAAVLLMSSLWMIFRFAFSGAPSMGIHLSMMSNGIFWGPFFLKAVWGGGALVSGCLLYQRRLAGWVLSLAMCHALALYGAVGLFVRDLITTLRLFPEAPRGAWASTCLAGFAACGVIGIVLLFAGKKRLAADWHAEGQGPVEVSPRREMLLRLIPVVLGAVALVLLAILHVAAGSINLGHELYHGSLWQARYHMYWHPTEYLYGGDNDPFSTTFNRSAYGDPDDMRDRFFRLMFTKSLYVTRHLSSLEARRATGEMYRDLFMEAIGPKTRERFDLMLAAEIDHWGGDAYSIDWLEAAIAAGDGRCLAVLQNRGHQIPPQGDPRLMLAAVRAGDMPMLRRLMDMKYNIHATDARGRNAVFYAALYDQFDMVTFLLEQGVDPKVHTQRGDSSLSAAIRGGNIDILRNLLRQGVDPKQHDTFFKSTLFHDLAHQATTFNSSELREIGELLQKAGLDPEAKDKNSLTAFEISSRLKRAMRGDEDSDPGPDGSGPGLFSR